MRTFLASFGRYRDYAPFVLRLVCSIRLFAAAGHTALHPSEGLPGYADWLQSLGFPFPMLSAALSAYGEVIGAVLILIGWQTRLAALLLIVNFTLAVLIGHVAIGDSYMDTFPALVILAISWFLLLNGPGKPSVDEGL